MIRMNQKGTRMDGPASEDGNNPAYVPVVVEHVHQVKKEGMGVISMKLCGEGSSRPRGPRSRHALRLQKPVWIASQSVSKTAQEIDEAIDNLNLALV